MDTVVSFHAISGMYSSAVDTTSLPVFEPPQYGASPAAVVLGAVPVTLAWTSPVNVFPPAPVTSGMAAGTSTAKPLLAEEPLSQSAAPASPEAATIVCPCTWPLTAQDSTVDSKLGGS